MVRARVNEPLVPTIGIRLNNTPLVADMALWIVRVIVEDDLDLPSMFSLEMISKEDETGIFPWTDDARLALGSAVEISMGYGDTRESMIIGEITALEPTFGIGGAPTLVVRGYDKRHRLNGAPRTHTYTHKTDDEIASTICARVNVRVSVTDSKVKHAYVLQADETDLRFLQERARRIHFELGMGSDGSLLFRPVGNAAKSAVSLTLGDDLIEFRPRMALVPLTEVTVLAWDPKSKAIIRASAKAGSEVSKMAGKRSSAQQAAAVFGPAVESVVRAPAFSQEEADRIAFARFNAAGLDFIQGDGRARGRTDINAGSVVQLGGLGDRFSGEYYVMSAIHSFSRHEGYITDFHVKRNAS